VSSLLALALAASTVLAVPTREARLAERSARRRLGRQSRPLDRTTERASNGTPNVDYSTNWAGAFFYSSPNGSFQSVTGTFIVPTPTFPSGGSSSKEYSASAWVGIDGATCVSAILQTGLDLNVEGTSVSYDAWYEWYPDYAYDFSGISFSPNDSVTLTVTATSKTSGTAVITNNSKNQTVTEQLTSSSSLCGLNAEWIVEDYEVGSALVPLANWGTVTFTGASAGLAAGGSVGPGNATIMDIKQGGTVCTSVSLGSSTVTIGHV